MIDNLARQALVVMTTLLLIAGCSSSDKETDSGGRVDAKADAAPDIGVDSFTDPTDAALPDAQPDKKLGPDSGSSLCDPTIVGQSCDPADDSACGGGSSTHRCVEVDDGVGFCTCTCNPDIAKTLVVSEDTCPSKKACFGEGDASACGSLLANAPQHPNCAKPGAIAPDASDTMLRFVAQLTPSAYPFWVTAIRYLLQADVEQCLVGPKHKAMVFVGTDNVPPASPSVLEEFPVATAAVTGSDSVWKIHPLSSPVKLEQGQHLFVAVEVPVTGQKSVCVQVCSDQSGVGDKSFISINESSPPYTWQSFAEVKWPGELTIAAIGFEG